MASTLFRMGSPHLLAHRLVLLWLLRLPPWSLHCTRFHLCIRIRLHLPRHPFALKDVPVCGQEAEAVLVLAKGA